MKILVAGATGVVGRALLPLLVREGHEVVGLSRQVVQNLTPGVRWRVADVFDREGLAGVLGEERPDAVVHQLTDLRVVSSAANARLRTEGTRHLVDAARAAGVERMVAQSIAWAYEPGAEVATEGTPLDVFAEAPRRVSIDGIVALETAVAEMPKYVILRYGMLYGPGTWYAEDGAMAVQTRAGELKATMAVTSFVHVADAAEACVQALGWPNGAVNVVDDEPVGAAEWMSEFARALGAPTPSMPDMDSLVQTRPVSNGYARSLGWDPVHASWRQGFFD